jgi:phage terminase large subunit-like protein
MAEVAQRLRRDNVACLREFPQGSDREKADASFYSLVMTGRLAHAGGDERREHLTNARAKIQPDEDSRMRLVKRSPRHKIDLAVAASMAVDRILRLRI